MALSLADIDNAEAAARDIRVKLDAIGREIYKVREGQEMDARRWHFSSYDRRDFSGTEYSGEEGPEWAKGTPIFSISYHWSYNGGGEMKYVTFPQSWLEQDYLAFERERADKQRAEEAEAERIAATALAERVARAERETFERLKAKFGETP